MRALRDPNYHPNVWTETSRLYDRADEGHAEKFVLDCLMVWQNFLDPVGIWQACQPGYSEPDGDGFHARFPRLPRLVRFSNGGSKRVYPVPGNDRVWIQLHKPEELTLGTPTSKVGGVWSWERPKYTFRLHVSPSGVKFSIYLPQPVGLTTLHIPYESQGLTRQGCNLLHNGKVVAVLRRPWVRDASGRKLKPGKAERHLDVQFGQGEIILTLDDTGLVYPLTIDPPLDLQVGAGADDGWRFMGTLGFNATTVGTDAGYDDHPDYLAMHNFDRWTGATFSGTIDVSHIQLYAEEADTGSPELKVHCVDEDNPAAPTSAAEFDADPLTAGVDWDGAFVRWAWNQSPSLNGPFQTLADKYSPSNEAVMVQVKDDLGSGASWHELFTWEYSTHIHGARLHLEFSVAPAGMRGLGVGAMAKMMGV